MNSIKDDELLELIPESRLSSPWLDAIRTETKENDWPIYKLLREPSNLNEIDWDELICKIDPYERLQGKATPKAGFSIWRDNETIICISKNKTFRMIENNPLWFSPFQYQGRCLSFRLRQVHELECTIYGKTDAAIAETAVFFLSLRHESVPRREIGVRFSSNVDFDFAAAFQPEQLAQILDANPTRKVDFSTGILSKEQSVILATRHYPLDLRFSERGNSEFPWSKTGVSFEDGGSAFLDALEKRTTPFGSISFDFYFNEMILTSNNLKRLSKLEVFEKLALTLVDEECAALPFSAKVNTLDYEIDSKHMKGMAIDSLDISTKNLNIKIFLDQPGTWHEAVLAFLGRLADLGHFERLSFGVDCNDVGGVTGLHYDVVAPLAVAIIRVISANQNLTYLSLSETHPMLDWTPHLKGIFKAMEEHSGLRTFQIDKYPLKVDPWGGLSADHYDPKYSWLKRLLSRNRTIKVLKYSGKICSDGWTVSALYSLNRFFCGSATLRKDVTLLRPLLVATALVKRASQNYQYSGLLLADHTDILCELIQEVNLEEVVDPITEAAVPTAAPGQSEHSKRPLRSPLPRAVKRAARLEM